MVITYPRTIGKPEFALSQHLLRGWIVRAAVCLVLATMGMSYLSGIVPGARGASPEPVMHTWKRLYYGQLDGQTGLLFGGRFDRAKPALGDLDGDGDLDMVLGRGDGHVMYFENQGSATKPDWRLINESISAFASRQQVESNTAIRIAVGANAAPALVDIDGDGDLDLFVGAADGKVRQYTNIGNRFLPTFVLESPDMLGKAIGFNVVVKFPDLNGDGLPDLSLGNEEGLFSIVLNQGTREEPRYCLQDRPDPQCLSVMEPLGRLSPEDNAVPEWIDWDRDGDLDLIVGKSDGTLAYWRNIGSAREGAWEMVATRFELLDAGGYAAPVFADIDGDGATDLLLAGDDERIRLMLGRPSNREFPLWLESRNALNILRLGGYQSRVQVATGDLDGDGDQDLVLGSRSGQLMVYENVSTGDLPAFRSPSGPLLPTPQRAFSAPALVDIDADGDLDMIVGGREGRLEWIENQGSPKQAQWRVRALFFGKVDVGSLSAPRFADLDRDGDPDLLVGNSLGQVVYYENAGSKSQPAFELRNVRFAGLQVSGNASPALFEWSDKTTPDLIVGDQTGGLRPAVRDPGMEMKEARAYQAQAPWQGLQADSYSAPQFTDLTGDGKPDLLVGTGSGSLLLWRYQGSGAVPETPPPSRAPRSNVVEGELSTPTVASASGLESPTPVGQGSASPSSQAGTDAPRDNLPLEPIFVYEDSPLERLDAGRTTHPAFFDYNGDGRPDLLVGNREGQVLLFENRGTSWRPVPGFLGDLAFGRNAAPVVADIDGDGDLDLTVGNESGRLSYLENTGDSRAARFTPRETFFRSVRGGRNAVPAFHDLDGDGKLDLLVGNLKGEMQYYRNTGKADDPFELVIRTFIGLDVGLSATPTFADLTREKRASLILGSDKGAIRILQPTSTSLERSSGWKENPTLVEGLKIPPGSHPALADIDGDGDMDMVVGSDAGKLVLYRNQAIQTGNAVSTR